MRAHTDKSSDTTSRTRDPRVYFVAIALSVALLGVAAAQWTQPPPIMEQGLVFFTPHPDDEPYAAAQTLAANARAGKRVVVVLLTDGEQSKDAGWWLQEHARDLDQDGDRDLWDFGLARRAEFSAAMDRLGVKETVFLGAADSQGARGFKDKELTNADIPAMVADTMARYPGAAPMTVMKAVDGDIYLGDTEAHPDHGALCEAVHAYAKAASIESYFFKPYRHIDAAWYRRLAPHYVAGDAEITQARLDAIDEFGLIGKRSWNELFDAARGARVEYMVKGEDF